MRTRVEAPPAAGRAGGDGVPREADAYCRAMLRGHYENFWVASPALPRRLRPHLARLYAYCRTTDDLGDESGAEAEARLELWSADLERCFGPGPPVHPVLLALTATIREFELPKEPFFDLVAANLQDQRVRRYQGWSELGEYCRRSAAPVGRLVLRLLGFSDGGLDALSDEVCVGLQLANFAQDVSIDAARGRCYLLQDDLSGLGPAGAVRATCERAHRLLRSGRALEARLPRRARLQVSLYRLGGEAILRAIARAGYRTDGGRPVVPAVTKLGLFPLALYGAARPARRSPGGLHAVA